MRRILLEWGIIGSIGLLLYITGMHTQVMGFIQQGILMTGLVRPDLKETDENSKADYGLTLVNSQGERVDMRDFKGKVIFLNFWATWCPPCLAEMPGINKLYNDVKEEDIVFLMVSLDKDFEKARKFKARKDFSFEVYRLAGSLPAQYHSPSIPTTFVISSEGKIVLKHTGMAHYDTERFRQFLSDNT